MDPMSDAADLVTSSGEAPASRRTDRLPPRAFRLGVRHHHSEGHAGHRAAWLRAAVLGANDGLLSTSSLLVGVASASAGRSVLLATGVAALVSGAGSMAIGEYSSVSSQRDAEAADLAKEAEELRTIPRAELAELTTIYEQRGLPRELAREVAEVLTEHDALGAHARDELGLDPDDLARPVEASVVSALRSNPRRSLTPATPAPSASLPTARASRPSVVCSQRSAMVPPSPAPTTAAPSPATATSAALSAR